MLSQHSTVFSAIAKPQGIHVVTPVTGVQVAATTDVGMRRTTNQDSYSLIVADTPNVWLNRGHFFMVADGMGAHAAGELASKLAADGVPYLYHKYLENSPPEALERAIRETNAEVNRRGTANPDFHNMGTTASCLVILPQGVILAHIGDSRAYRLRNNVVEQLTFDHSLQWELRASGALPDGSDLSAAVPKNVITRSLGPNPTVQIDLEGPHPAAVGDVYMLCSDGLTGRVEDHELGMILGCLPAAEASQALVDLANLRGGPDNITVLVGRVESPQVATGGTQAPPLTVGGKSDVKTVSPIFWIVTGVAVLTAMLTAVLSLYIVAIGALAVGAISAGVGLIQRYSGMSSGTALGANRMLGRGPYTSTPAAPNREFLDKLAATVEELREAARESNSQVTWAKFDDFCRRASSAGKSGDIAEGIRQYCRCISFTLAELRAQNTNNKKSGDSAIQY